jgi:hypothetical protein
MTPNLKDPPRLTNVSQDNIFTERACLRLALGVFPPAESESDVLSLSTFSYIELGKRRPIMVVAPTHHSIISLIAGILILTMPRLLNYIVAIYLIIIGLLGVFR